MNGGDDAGGGNIWARKTWGINRQATKWADLADNKYH
jgi:hypothetical protein